MAVNQNHTENRRGAVIPYGESVLKQCQDVELSFPQQPEGSNFFSGTKRGILFLTSHRVIFVTSHSASDPMFSFMMPFDLMSNCTIEQPVFAPNYIKGTIQAAPDGGWEGQATFKLAFRKGGAIKFGQLMMKAASAAAQGAPLGSVNYWLGAPGLYFFTGQGSMMCSQEVPCPAYPVIMYGPQPVRYGAPSGGYGAPPAGYGAPLAGYGASPLLYGAQPTGYGAPPAGYGAPSGGYGAPPAGYGAPSGGYGAPPAGYGAPSGGYGAPPAGYGAPPEASEALSAGYGAPPERYESPPVGYGALPAGSEASPAGYGTPLAGNETPPLGYETAPTKNRAGSHKSAAAQPAEYEASLPSASSTQAHSPPSEK
ncbi:PREDICTED: postacrosomal sheath WW domain-binding protein [Hipposideros armiger]|uniref:Postacrosomal sheath WW domain-binding protein n=1 Tax=Hipposideros armiger TaxID=186990 RepID=A0A8B7PSY7_HIPAR|nr:PREDICTED: postacrosomal sheath WW domain-binding protein [Hipposideros armiger]